MEVSCLKWNLFRFGSGTRITYLQNQHAPFLAVKVLLLVPPQQSNSLFVFLIWWNKKTMFFYFRGFAAVLSLSLWLSLLSDRRQNKQLNRRCAGCMLDRSLFLLWFWGLETDKSKTWFGQDKNTCTLLNSVSIRLGACWINCFFLCYVNFSHSWAIYTSTVGEILKATKTELFFGDLGAVETSC